MKPITRRRIVDRIILDKLKLKTGVGKIAIEVKVGKRRVREVREKGIAHGYLDAKGTGPGHIVPPPAPLALFPDPEDGRSSRTSLQDQLLSERLEWVKERLLAGWAPITIFEELGKPEIGRSSFYRFLDRHSLHDLGKSYRAPTLIAPIVHEPGEALILDWGKIRDVIDPVTGLKRVLWAFVGVLGYSRYMVVRLVWTNDVPTTCEAIESMLREIGGVTRRVTSDNPKCFAIQADFYDPILNPAFLRFAAHYGFVMECLPPRDPQKKGKVERMIAFTRRLFEAYSQEFVSLEHAQAYMDRKVAIANERKHGTTCQQPIEVFLSQEVSHLRALPPIAYEREEVAYPIVRRDGYVRFVNKYYAVADQWIGSEVVVIGTSKQVSIYGKNKLIEVYDRITSKSNETHTTKDHLQKPWQKLEEQNQGYLKVAGKIGPQAEEFVKATLARGGGFVDTRIIWGFLSLDKKYPREAVNKAAGIALEMGQLSSRLVERLIKLTLTPNDTVPDKSKQNQNNKFIRPMSVYRNRIDGSVRTG